MKLSGYLVCLWMVAVLGYCTVRIMWPAYRNVENKAEVSRLAILLAQDIRKDEKVRLDASIQPYFFILSMPCLQPHKWEDARQLVCLAFIMKKFIQKIVIAY